MTKKRRDLTGKVIVVSTPTEDSNFLSLIALIAASKQITSIPVTTTLVDTLPDDEWDDERVGEWNINAGQKTST